MRLSTAFFYCALPAYNSIIFTRFVYSGFQDDVKGHILSDPHDNTLQELLPEYDEEILR